jgi:hypothetical protein
MNRGSIKDSIIMVRKKQDKSLFSKVKSTNEGTRPVALLKSYSSE